ncbi:MAG: hypothetical protein M3373_13890 [Gemmatimonadota bacterium]|nr:hypothetical protein [Gemmatimonadota bacterium]
MRFLLVGAAALSLIAGVAAAQDVGSPPAESPFRDVAFRQELSAFTGYFSGAKGRAGVGPSGGPMAGVRYEIRIGGPAQFTFRAARAWTERVVLDPGRPEESRELGTRPWPIHIADVGITLNLTGQKSWHNLVPVLHGGIGIATDFGKAVDTGGFDFGTPFAFTLGGGVRWVREGNLQLRLDVADYLYQLRYPDTYFIPPANVPPILRGTSAKGDYNHNLAVTVGASYLFFR